MHTTLLLKVVYTILLLLVSQKEQAGRLANNWKTAPIPFASAAGKWEMGRRVGDKGCVCGICQRHMERTHPGCSLCAVITQPPVAARISAQNGTYLDWGGRERTR